MKSTLTVTIILSILLLGACESPFEPEISLNLSLDRYATEKEITGRWMLIPQTLEILKLDGYAPASAIAYEIIFREDGTCDFRSIVASWKTAKYFNAHCSWKLLHDSSKRNKKVIKNIVYLQIKDDGILFYLAEENGHLFLWDFWGDPDDWELIKYEKMKAKKVMHSRIRLADL